MILIGLTGGIACGKSTVSSLLESEYNIHIIDADRIVRELQVRGAPCTKRIAKRWPTCVDASTGELNRAALGQVVFADAGARRALAQIMNGPIFRAILHEILRCWWRCSTDEVVILDAPTLFETKTFTYLISSSVVVACSEERQVERLRRRNGYDRDEALRRIRSQMPLNEKRRLAGYVIENDVDDAMNALKHSVAECVGWMGRQSQQKVTIIVGGTAVAAVAVVAVVLRVAVNILRRFIV